MHRFSRFVVCLFVCSFVLLLGRLVVWSGSCGYLLVWYYFVFVCHGVLCSVVCVACLYVCMFV